MSDAPQPPRRPTLKLKVAPPIRTPEPPRPKPVAAGPKRSGSARSGPRRAPAAPAHAWKCKPCGTALTPAPAADAPEWVRCPSCNARLGRLTDFQAEPPNLDKLRARPAKK